MLTLLAVSSLCAYAGTWTTEYGVDGRPPVSLSDGFKRWSSNTQVNANVAGIVDVYLVWNHSAPYGMDKPPVNAVALIRATATAGKLGNVAGEMSVSNGFNDPIEGSISTGGSHLVQKKNTSLAERVLIGTYSLHASSPNGVAYIRLYAEPDTRFISFVRQNAHDETVDADGTIHGDTIYSFTDYYPAAGGQISFFQENKNLQMFSVTLNGEWHKKRIYINGNPFNPADVLDITFAWNPPSTHSDYYYNEWLQKFGTTNRESGSWKGTPDSPNTETLTYTVTDNADGAKADATYVLTKHDQVQNLTNIRSQYFSWNRVGTMEIFGQKKAGYENEIAQDTGGTWSISGSLPAISSWFPVFGIAYTFQPPPTINRKISLANDLNWGEYAKVYRVDSINRNTQYWRAYDAGGVLLADWGRPGVMWTSFFDTLNDYNFSAIGRFAAGTYDDGT